MANAGTGLQTGAIVMDSATKLTTEHTLTFDHRTRAVAGRSR